MDKNTFASLTVGQIIRIKHDGEVDSEVTVIQSTALATSHCGIKSLQCIVHSTEDLPLCWCDKDNRICTGQYCFPSNLTHGEVITPSKDSKDSNH